MQKHFYLTEEEKKLFYENGFSDPFTRFEPDEMTEIWNEIRMDLLDTSSALFPDSKLNYDRHLDLPQLNRIISHPRLVDKISLIFGPDVLSWRTEWFPKYPGDEGTDWHQAESFVEFEGTEKLEPTAVVEGQPWELTAWIAMTKTNKANGCLKLMPGSHRTWYFDKKRNVKFDPDNINKLNTRGEKSGFYGYDYDDLKLDRDMEIEPGQFFIFTSRCMHRSNSNSTKDDTRFAWATRFIPTHVKVMTARIPSTTSVRSCRSIATPRFSRRRRGSLRPQPRPDADARGRAGRIGPRRSSGPRSPPFADPTTDRHRAAGAFPAAPPTICREGSGLTRSPS
ncbi:chlorinating enzyme [Breoghania sp.]|uniref:chlorinating enzyme n=1 Tax=Breoghania sp. TaxID=2065378 RepID=UPI0026026449|nr:chlorinating enzyme [Breoghania sp.]MDJ0933192.1 chlorinating enzyme [Breoghania sp.]